MLTHCPFCQSVLIYISTEILDDITCKSHEKDHTFVWRRYTQPQESGLINLATDLLWIEDKKTKTNTFYSIKESLVSLSFKHKRISSYYKSLSSIEGFVKEHSTFSSSLTFI